ncbi:hypothetical protein [Aquirhabdus sp.]|uniref:hypothetical protein n=1 Tax=Aquirhabdus sp. TaxID=2824160 RepID=UPI00396CEA87
MGRGSNEKIWRKLLALLGKHPVEGTFEYFPFLELPERFDAALNCIRTRNQRTYDEKLAPIFADDIPWNFEPIQHVFSVESIQFRDAGIPLLNDADMGVYNEIKDVVSDLSVRSIVTSTDLHDLVRFLGFDDLRRDTDVTLIQTRTRLRDFVIKTIATRFPDYKKTLQTHQEGVHFDCEIRRVFSVADDRYEEMVRRVQSLRDSSVEYNYARSLADNLKMLSGLDLRRRMVIKQ